MTSMVDTAVHISYHRPLYKVGGEACGDASCGSYAPYDYRFQALQVSRFDTCTRSLRNPAHRAALVSFFTNTGGSQPLPLSQPSSA
jgi:hypothetical protein